MKIFDLTREEHIYAQIGGAVVTGIPANDSVKEKHIIDLTLRFSRRMNDALDELQAMDNAREVSKWFKTDSVFDVYRTGKQIKSPILEVVR